jgi:hypothetical protein
MEWAAQLHDVVSDQVHPLEERQVELLTEELQLAGVPTQVAMPSDHLQPFPDKQLEHKTFKRHFSFAEWAFPHAMSDKTHYVN